MVIVLASAATPASGQSVEEPKPITVASLHLEGVTHLDEASVRDVMVTEAPSRIPFTKDPPYQVSQLRGDVDRIEALYAARGYPSARVTRVSADVDQEQRSVAIVVIVDEGEPRQAGQVSFSGFDDIDADRLARAPKTAGYTAGAPLDVRWVEQIRDESLLLLRDAGHANASVDVREVERAPGGPIDLTYTATPGPVMRVGAIDIAGTASVRDDVIRRRLTFKPGDVLRQSQIDDSERSLRNLELFDFAYVEPRRDEAVNGQVPVRVTVTEDRHRRVDLSVGYGTEEKARAQASWRNVNVGGRARTVGIEGRASALEWGTRASVLEPFFLSRHVSLGATAHWWFENEPIYRMRTYGARATTTWQHDTRDVPRGRGVLSSIGLTVINDFTRYSVSDFALDDPSYRAQLITLGLDPETGESEGTLLGLRVQLQRSSVLNPLDARQGQAVTLAVERAGRVLSGDFAYTEFVGDARAYRSMGGVVLAARGRVGAITGSADGVPFFKRYFLGGSTSLRGWGRYDVSPLTDSGLPIGGLSLVETSAEARVPIGSKFALVGFVDAGNVWAASGDIDLGDLRVSVGPGLRYTTPIGPVRLDFGYQLTPIDGLVVRGTPEQRQWRVHFSIGQAF